MGLSCFFVTLMILFAVYAKWAKVNSTRAALVIVVLTFCGVTSLCVGGGQSQSKVAAKPTVKPTVTPTVTNTVEPTVTPNPIVTDTPTAKPTKAKPKPTKVKPTATVISGVNARYHCQEFVRDVLKVPSSADFGNLMDNKAKTKFFSHEVALVKFDKVAMAKAKNKGGVWLVVGEAEAENGFGAMIVIGYACLLNNDGDTWYLLDRVVE